MQSKLRSLDILPDSRWAGSQKHEVVATVNDLQWKGNGRDPITLKGFNKLKYLDMPMKMLGLPAGIVFQDADDQKIEHISTGIVTDVIGGGSRLTEMEIKAKVLPLSLTSLRLRSCTAGTFALLAKIIKIPMEKLRLTYIDLYFDLCARSSILQCFKEDRGELDCISILSELEQKGVHVTFYTGKQHKITDMRPELARLYLLIPSEVGLIASEVNMAALKRRRSYAVERKLFAKYALVHFDLLNSPTFDGNLWKVIAIFQGIKNTKYDHSLLPRSQSVVIGVRNEIKPKPKRWGSALFDVGRAPFKFRMTPLATLKSPYAVVFCGRLFSTLFDSSMRSAVEDVRMTGPDLDQIHKKAGVATTTAGKARRKVHKKSTRKGTVEFGKQSQPTSICSEGVKTEKRFEQVSGFACELWRDVRWKDCMQPRVKSGKVEEAIKSRSH
jgi:hypothetical protein